MRTRLLTAITAAILTVPFLPVGAGASPTDDHCDTSVSTEKCDSGRTGHKCDDDAAHKSEDGKG